MNDLISKSTLRKELSKLSSEMGYVRKTDVMQILNKQSVIEGERKQCNIKQRGLTPLEELIDMASKGRPYRI